MWGSIKCCAVLSSLRVYALPAADYGLKPLPPVLRIHMSSFSVIGQFSQYLIHKDVIKY